MEFLKQNIKQLRRERKLTQNQLAELLRVKRSSVGAYENGRAAPRLPILNKLTSIFEVSYNDLLSTNLILRNKIIQTLNTPNSNENEDNLKEELKKPNEYEEEKITMETFNHIFKFKTLILNRNIPRINYTHAYIKIDDEPWFKINSYQKYKYLTLILLSQSKSMVERAITSITPQ